MRKKQKKSKCMSIGTVLFIFFLAIYIPSLIYWLTGAKTIKTSLLKKGSIEDAVSVKAIIIRNESIIMPPFDGKCVAVFSEGERVGVGSSIATVYKENTDKLIRDIDELDQKILDSQKNDAQNDTIFSEDIKKIDKSIDENLRRLTFSLTKRDFEQVTQTKIDISSLTKKKAEITGSLSTADIKIKELKKQKDEYKKLLDEKKREISTETSGIVSYSVDGLEKILHPDMISTIKSKELEEIKQKITSFTSGSEVKAEVPFAKIIDNLEGYLVVSMSDKEAQGLEVDSTVSVRIIELGNKVIQGSIDYISKEENKNSVIAVKINKGIDETSRLRTINVDIIKKQITGFKVPIISLRDISSDRTTAKIMLSRYNYSTLKNVRILGENGEYAIIDGPEEKELDSISLYDEYLIDALSINEGEVVRN